MTGMLSHAVAGMALAMACAIAPAQAQSISSDTAKMLAPTGTLRVGVLMVWYFALEDKASGKLAGVIPDLGRELARRAGVAAELIKLENPGAVMAAFRNNALDVTFIGITADRAEVMQYGPTVIDLQTTYLVPASSKIASIEEIDQPGLRILVPQRSAARAWADTERIGPAVRCRTGTVPRRALGGPGSAVHRSAAPSSLRRLR